MFWDDGHSEEGYIRRLPLREMLRAVGGRLWPHRRDIWIAVALLLVSVATETAGPLILRRLIDQDIPQASKTGALHGLMGTAALYLVIFLAGAGAGYVQALVVARLGIRMVTRLKRDLFEHVLGLGMGYFDQHPPGRLMARIESDAERLQSLFSETALAVLRIVLLLGATLGIMFWLNWRITATLVGLAVPLMVATLYYLTWMRRVFGALRRYYASLNTIVTEYVQAVPLLRAFGRLPWAMEKLRRANRRRYLGEIRAGFLEYGFWSVFHTLEILAVMVILWLGFRHGIGQGLTLGTLVMFVEYSRRLFFPIAMFAEMFNHLQRSFASADRVFSILATRDETADAPDCLTEVPADWREIAFEQVTFGYGDAPPAVEEISFTLRRGERVALAGPSGGGKSTLASLLLRFYEPRSGRITLDGVDIRRYAMRAWRSRLGLVLQDIHLFPGTVADNLRVFNEEIPETALRRATRALGAEDIVERLPLAYATPLAEGGQNLSMGERQIISFARAVVREPDILVLDEATSSVDPATEKRLQQSLARLFQGRTSLVVAHRLATITGADRILLLQQGRIIEEGSHAELYARGGVYRGLFDLQFRAGEVA